MEHRSSVFMHTWSEKVLLGAISACCVCGTWWLCSVKYGTWNFMSCFEVVEWLDWRGRVKCLDIQNSRVFFSFFYHLLGKVPFPTVWELCLIINACALIRCSKKRNLKSQCWKWNFVSPKLNSFVLMWPRHPWSSFQTQLFPLCSVQTRISHFSCPWP